MIYICNPSVLELFPSTLIWDKGSLWHNGRTWENPIILCYICIQILEHNSIPSVALLTPAVFCRNRQNRQKDFELTDCNINRLLIKCSRVLPGISFLLPLVMIVGDHFSFHITLECTQALLESVIAPKPELVPSARTPALCVCASAKCTHTSA